MVAELMLRGRPAPEGEPRSEGYPLMVLVGPTGSGKSGLAMRLAEAFGGEIVSCDSVAVYLGMEIGSAKPSPSARELIPHHALDLLAPDQPCTAGDYARAARLALASIRGRGAIPFVVGGTGLYLRALLEGLAPAPPRDPGLRDRLREHAKRQGSASLHRLLRRFDPQAARSIHPHDTPKLVRSLEVSLGGRRPQTEQWSAGRDALQGYRVLKLGLEPPRAELCCRLNERAAAMFENGLLEETAALIASYGTDCEALRALGYAQAREVLRGSLAPAEALSVMQAGHRQYAKRQLTWFRRDAKICWLRGFGEEPSTVERAAALLQSHLQAPAGVECQNALSYLGGRSQA